MIRIEIELDEKTQSMLKSGAHFLGLTLGQFAAMAMVHMVQTVRAIPAEVRIARKINARDLIVESRR